MKFGLLGAKLGHSLSPQIHQEVFRQLGITATYELIEVPGECLADKVAELRKTYLGLNVTIPHKVAVMESLDDVATEAKAIGAVNTIFFNGEKRLRPFAGTQWPCSHRKRGVCVRHGRGQPGHPAMCQGHESKTYHGHLAEN